MVKTVTVFTLFGSAYRIVPNLRGTKRSEIGHAKIFCGPRIADGNAHFDRLFLVIAVEQLLLLASLHQPVCSGVNFVFRLLFGFCWS